jgi:hypothetical protein
MRRNVEVVVSFGGLHEKHAVQRGVLGTNQGKPRKTLINTSQETHYELSIGLFVPHRKLIINCL